MNTSYLTKQSKMAKKLSFTSFPLKAMVLHLSLLAITQSHAKTERVLTFFMHDIIGGSAPSERIVAGTIANPQTSNLPFAKPNNRVLPNTGSIPLVDTNIGTNSELSGNSPTSTVVISNIGKSKVVIDHGSTLPFVKPSQLPLAATLDKLLFGRITVIDDEITQGHELGSLVIGKAQGFHLASSLDGSSQTMAFTALFHNEDSHNDQENAISFLGVHRTAAHESNVAVVGGTGKYDSATGYAKIQTLHLNDQGTTNGVETLLQITVYLS